MVNTKILLEIAGILQRGLGSDETFEAVFDILERSVPYDYATLFLYDQESDQLEVIHQIGDERVDLAGEISFDRGLGMSSWISHQSNPVIIPSLMKSRPGKDQRFSSFVSMPLKVGDKLIGVLNLAHNEPDTYQRSEMADYESVQLQISNVMDKIMLRRSLAQKNSALEQAMKDLETAQGKLIEKERLAAIGEIVVTVNHEINNPLTSIIGLAEILELTIHTTSKDKMRDALKTILKAARKIQKVTDRLKSINSSEAQDYVGDTKMTRLPSSS